MWYPNIRIYWFLFEIVLLRNLARPQTHANDLASFFRILGSEVWTNIEVITKLNTACDLEGKLRKGVSAETH